MTLTIKLAAGNGGTPDSTDPGGSVRFNENSLTKDMLIGTIEGGQPGWTYKFNFADGFYGDGGGRFYIVGNKIYVKAVVDPATGESLFNFEVQGLHTMSVLAFATPDAVVDVDEGQFGVYVDDVNDAPVNLALNPPTGTVLQVAENLPANQLVGTLVEFDEDRDAGMGDGDGIFTYAITVNPGNKFALRDGANGLKEVVTTGPLDYEANDPLLKTDTVNGGKYYEITVRVTDNGGAKAGTPLSTEKTFRVYVTDVNDGNTSPTDISLSSTTVAEDQTAGAVIGTLSATDAQGGAMTYAIQGDPDSKFAIVGNQLVVRNGATFNFEGKTTHTVTVRVTDSGGLTYDKQFTINVSNVNEKPTDIGLSGTSVSSTAGGGTAIGNLTFTDPDAGATGTFTIFNDANGYFQIGTAGGAPQLQVRNGATLAVGTYTVTVRVTDQGGLTYDKQFTINVTSGNTSPTDISLSSTTVAEDQTAGAVIGTLSATDAQGGAMTYAIQGDPDSKFAIVGNQLVVRNGATFNFEGKTTHTVTVRVTDSGGLTYDKQFTINVSNVNEKPTDIGLSGTSVSSTAGGGTAIGNLTFTDPDAGATGTFTIFNDANGYFQIGTAGGAPQLQVRNGATLAVGTYTVTVRVTDQGGLTYDKQFTINVTSGNTSPTDISLSSTTVAEDQTGGVVIGTLGATDAQGGAMTYSIVNDPDSKFEIVGNQLRVRAGATFNYENDTAHDVRIRVTDSGGLTYEETFTINVSNVNEKPTDIGLSGTSVSSTAGGGTAIGNLTFTDPDAGATGTFTILNDPSGYFQVVVINGNPQLQVRDGATLAAGTYAVTLRVTDQGGLTYDKQFTINVVNGNVDPKIVGASDPLVKTTSDRADIQAFKNLTIQDSGTLRVVVSMDNASKGKFSGDGGIYDKDAGTFTIEGSAQFVTAALQALRFDARDKATGSAAEVTNFTITVTDSEGAVASNSNISVSATAPDAPPANRAPTGLAPSNVTLQELTKNGTPIATLSASDADGDKLTYKIILANGVAADTDGYFTVSGNQLLVANGVMFDAEQALLRQVTIEVSDGRGGVARQTFTFNISDKSPETMVASDASPFNDIIKGSKTGKFKDTFYGGAGDDKLWGGYGNDTLWGGSGKDTFVFDAKLGTAKTDRSVNFDTIKDYSVKDDSIWLENSLFKGNKTLYAKIKKGTENKPVKLDKKFFTIGDKAKEKDDYFVYDSKKRVLYYDADGSGSKEAIELATFTKNKYLKNFQYSELFFI